MNNQGAIQKIFAIMAENNLTIKNLKDYEMIQSAQKTSKWGDDAVGLFDNEPVQQHVQKEMATISTQTELFVQLGDEKVLTPRKEEQSAPVPAKKVAVTEPVAWKNVVTSHNCEIAPQPTKPMVKQTEAKKPYAGKEPEVIYTLQDFLDCIKQKMRMHTDFVIADEAHCPHTFEGTLCPNVRRCGMIHVQRCIHNLDCSHKYCAFLHVDDMPTEDAKDNFMDTMEQYNAIKNQKKSFR